MNEKTGFINTGMGDGNRAGVEDIQGTGDL